jgi:hypothetical protein
MDTRDKPDFIIPSVLAQSARLRAQLHRAADFYVAQNAISAQCLVSTGGGAGTRTDERLWLRTPVPNSVARYPRGAKGSGFIR